MTLDEYIEALTELRKQSDGDITVVSRDADGDWATAPDPVVETVVEVGSWGVYSGVVVKVSE